MSLGSMYSTLRLAWPISREPSTLTHTHTHSPIPTAQLEIPEACPRGMRNVPIAKTRLGVQWDRQGCSAMLLACDGPWDHAVFGDGLPMGSERVGCTEGGWMFRIVS